MTHVGIIPTLIIIVQFTPPEYEWRTELKRTETPPFIWRFRSFHYLVFEDSNDPGIRVKGKL